MHDLAPAYARAGWRLESADRLGEPELAALGTSWTRRLGSTRSELAVLALRGRVNPATDGPELHDGC